MKPAVLRLGGRAPEFCLPSGDGKSVCLSQLKGKRVVLYFYPKDDTPGCTKEACAFEASKQPFTKAGAVILGISADNAASHQRFAGKYGISFTLLSDADYSVCKAYGVYKKKLLYGRSFLGIERTTFVIDEAGRVSAIFPKVKVDGHIPEVLAAVLHSSHGSQAFAAPAFLD